MGVALFLSAVLVIIGAGSMALQVKTLRTMSERAMASDERSYFRRRAYRRLINGVLLLGLAGMLAGSHLSGMEEQATALAQRDNQGAEPTPEDRAFLKFYGYYWIGIIVLVFLVIVVAMSDVWATRRYAITQLRRLRDEHTSKLSRDLAVYRQQHHDRMRATGDVDQSE